MTRRIRSCNFREPTLTPRQKKYCPSFTTKYRYRACLSLHSRRQLRAWGANPASVNTVVNSFKNSSGSTSSIVVEVRNYLLFVLGNPLAYRIIKASARERH